MLFGVNNTLVLDLLNILKLCRVELIQEIVINGHLSKVKEIHRGVKQGDALSSEIFIICIDSSLDYSIPSSFCSFLYSRAY